MGGEGTEGETEREREGGREAALIYCHVRAYFPGSRSRDLNEKERERRERERKREKEREKERLPSSVVIKEPIYLEVGVERGGSAW